MNRRRLLRGLLALPFLGWLGRGRVVASDYLTKFDVVACYANRGQVNANGRVTVYAKPRWYVGFLVERTDSQWVISSVYGEGWGVQCVVSSADIVEAQEWKQAHV